MSNQNLFNLLKLRASWGKLGNPDITRGYDKLTTIINSGAYFGGIGNPAETVTKIVNPDIDWETTTGRDIGVEMALLNNKLKLKQHILIRIPKCSICYQSTINFRSK